MIETNNIHDLARIVLEGGKRRIGIDGANGSGKSTLSTELSKVLGFSHINLDDYLEKNKGGFLEYLRYKDIEKKLQSLEKYVVEGVCLLEVLEKINHSIDYFVYVQRMRHGIWADEDECDIAGSIEEYIKKEKEAIRIIERTDKLPDTLGLIEEIIRYHAEYLPHKKANILFKRNDD
jgi:uridine kinase